MTDPSTTPTLHALPGPAVGLAPRGLAGGPSPLVQPAPPHLFGADVVAEDFINGAVRVQALEPATQPQPRVPSLSDRCDDYSCVRWRRFDPPPMTRALVYWLPVGAAGAVVAYGAIEGRQEVATLGVLGGVAWLALSTTFGLLCWR